MPLDDQIHQCDGGCLAAFGYCLTTGIWIGGETAKQPAIPIETLKVPWPRQSSVLDQGRVMREYQEKERIAEVRRIARERRLAQEEQYRVAILEREQDPTFRLRNRRAEVITDLIMLKGSECGLCGEVVDESDCEIDHIHPRSAGGGDELENLHLVHPICNRRKGARYAA